MHVRHLAPLFLALALPAVRVSAIDYTSEDTRYLVLDLTDGNRVEAFYPIGFLSAVPEGGWNEDFKTNFVVLRRIDPGVFTMGCSRTERGYAGTEVPQHEVQITRPFYIGVFEMTQSQCARLLGFPPGRFKGDLRPAECLSWIRLRGERAGAQWPKTADVDEESLLGILRTRTGIQSWDLPTEAQWEYACRAGTTNAINGGFDLSSTGHDERLDLYARYSTGMITRGGRDAVPQHADVGSFEPNAWGLYDMHGNVSEWCRDWYVGRSEFREPVRVDPIGPWRQTERVVRGGSWFDYARLCRSASRFPMSPRSGSPRVGFRLFCEPPTDEDLEAHAALAAEVTAERTPHDRSLTR